MVFAWTRRRDDLACFALICAAALVLSPVAWGDYIAVLVIPLAVWRPGYSTEWLLLPAFWFRWWLGPFRYGAVNSALTLIVGAAWLLLIVRRDRMGQPTSRPVNATRPKVLASP